MRMLQRTIKPKPDLILRAIKEFELKAYEAIVVEDSVHGISAAKRAGTRVIGVFLVLEC